MVVSRRDFMKRGSLVVLATGVSLCICDPTLGKNTDVGSWVSPQEYDPLLYFTKATFVQQQSTVFRIYPKGSKLINAKLVGVNDIGPVPDHPVPGRECFVLKFSGPSSLSQGTYRIEHNVLGTFNLFLVPSGKDKKGFYYQAVINRLNP